MEFEDGPGGWILKGGSRGRGHGGHSDEHTQMGCQNARVDQEMTIEHFVLPCDHQTSLHKWVVKMLTRASRVTKKNRNGQGYSQITSYIKNELRVIHKSRHT